MATATIISGQLSANRPMFRYDQLARLRQEELLREAEMARLRRLASDARRVHPARPEQRRGFIARRP